MDRLQAVGGAHHDASAAALEVAALDELDAHRAGQQRVLEVGTVVDPRGEHDDGRVGDAGRRGSAQRGEKPLRVARDRTHPVVREGLRQRRRDRATVGHDVRHPRRDAHVVLEDAEAAVDVADQVDAGDVHAYAVGRAHTGGLAVEVRGGGHHAARDHAVLEHLPDVIDVGQERLERTHPLPDPGVDLLPGLHLDDPRHDVERERPLLTADVEGDALVEVGGLQRLDPRSYVVGVEVGEVAAQREVGLAGAVRVVHLVIGLAGGVVVEQAAHGRTLVKVRVRGVARV